MFAAVLLGLAVAIPVCLCAAHLLLPSGEDASRRRAQRIHRAILAHRARRELARLAETWERQS